MKKSLVAPTLLLMLSSCSTSSASQNEQNKLGKAQDSCKEYVRAYVEESNLDPFAEDVVKKLDIPQLNLLDKNLNQRLNQIDDEYPGLTDEDMTSSDYMSSVIAKYGAEALNQIREYAQMFKDIDMLIRDSCDTLESNTLTSVP